MNEPEALHAASSALARLDERLRTDPLADVLARWSLTREAIGCVACEGLAVRESDFVAVLAGADAAYDKSTRTTEDVHAALALAVERRRTTPTPESVVEIFKRSEAMNLARSRETVDGVIDNDAIDLSARMEAITSPDPWTSAHNLRSVMRETRFRGRGKRVAFLLSPWLTCSGFGLSRATPLLAGPLALLAGSDGFGALLEEPDEWATVYFTALASGARKSYDALVALGRLSAEASDVLGKRRARSRFVPAVEAFLGQPIQSIGDMASTLGATHAGATFLVDSLVAAGIVTPHDSDRGKGRLFVMRKALGL